MENNESKRPEELKEILKELSSDDSTVVISDGDADGKLEFHFESKRSGLVFEEDEPREAGLHFESDGALEPAPSEEPTKAEADPVAVVSFEEPAVTERGEEFALPDNFDVVDEAESVEENTRRWSAYVPRFTDVSETYRMSDDPRPRPDKVTKTEKSEKTVVTEIADTEEMLDATDESLEETENVDAVVVNLGQKIEVEEQSFSVYKFSDPDAEPASEPLPRERTVEDERAEINSLINKTTEISSQECEVREDLREKPQASAAKGVGSAAPRSPAHYKLPDPDSDTPVHVVDFPETVAPDGACDSSASGRKKDRSEFTANLQRDSFKDRFLDSIMSVKIRFFAALILTLTMIVFENLRFFGVNPAALIGLATFPGAMAIADLQFAACIFILALPEIISAVRRLIRGKFSPELSLILSLAVLATYTAVIIGKIPPNSHDYPLFGSLLAAEALAAILGTCLKRSADFSSFKRITEAEEKQVLDKKLTRTLERENLALDGAVDETKSKIVRVFKTTFVADFFKKTGATVEDGRGVIITLSVSFGAALVGAIIAFFLGDGWVSAATTFAAIALITVPAASILIHKLPYHRTVLKCESERSTVLGESSLYDYSGVDVITFNDVDVFGAEDVNLKRIIHYGNVDNVMKAMRQMSSIFANVGGPLERIFVNSLDRKSPPATNAVIERDGIFGRVDGHGVCAGTAEYMTRHGIVLPPDAEASRLGISDSTRVMYGAEDGVVYVQFHIRYAFSEEFTMALPSLKDDRIVALIYTEDPNLSNELLSSLTGGEDNVRIMKRCLPKITEEKVYARISTGIVISDDKLDAVSAILLSKKYVRLMRTLSVASTVATVLGCVLSSLLSIFGLLDITSLAFVGWQLLWCFALYIVSLKSFSVKKKEENTNDR